MSNDKNLERLRANLLEVRQLIEQYGDSPHADAHLKAFDQLIGPYMERAYAREFAVSDAVLQKVEAQVQVSREAAAVGSWRRLAASNRAMVSGLPGDPVSLPDDL